jgi:hypothetical protein
MPRQSHRRNILRCGCCCSRTEDPANLFLWLFGLKPSLAPFPPVRHPSCWTQASKYMASITPSWANLCSLQVLGSITSSHHCRAVIRIESPAWCNPRPTALPDVFQRAAGKAIASLPKAEPERQPTPLTSPGNSEDEGMSGDQRRQVEKAKRMAARSAPKRAAASPRAPADQPTGAKGPPPTKGQVKGQESPETKVSKPMETRRQAASRAGGLRSGGGSGQKDTSVSRGNPSKT